MNKYELAEYLCNLNTLLEAQSKGIHSIPSRVLADEYNRSWTKLKDFINKDQEDEARNRIERSSSDESGADGESRISRSGESTGNPRRDLEGSGVVIQRPRV